MIIRFTTTRSKSIPGACGFAILASVLLLGAAPPLTQTDDLIRRGNAEYSSEDIAAADQLYAAAEERTSDPGLVAYNRAAVLFQKGDFRAAELQYARVLDDRDCPSERRTRAWFNRGTCLLRRGGQAAVYRSAIACFERSLDNGLTDLSLAADARHNLELAKLLWLEANRKAARPENPNAPAPEDFPNEPPAPKKDDHDPSAGDTEQNPGTDGSKNSRPATQQAAAPPKSSRPTQTDAQTAGNNSAMPVLKDEDKPQPLSPEDTREYLKRTADRLQRERQGMLRMLYGPDLPGVRDW